MTSEQPVPRFFLFLMAIAMLLVGAVFLPLASELLIACVLASVLWPLRQWLTRTLRGRRGVAAGVLTTGVVLVLLGPIAAAATFIIRDGSDGVAFVYRTAHGEEAAKLIAELPASARNVALDAIDRLPRDLGEAIGQLGDRGTRAAAALGAAGVGATLMIVALFFLLHSGDQLVSWLDSVSPLPRGSTRELLGMFGRVSYAVLVSAVVTAAVQAAAALVGYFIAQVPNPFFFATVTFFVAFVPAIGAASVCLVAAALLLATGHPYPALFLAIWGVVVVGLVDNVIKPLLIKRGMEIHGGVVFFSLLGGLAAFGAIGLLIGPLAVAFFLALLRMYHRDFTPGESRVPAVPGLPATDAAPPAPASASGQTA
ncbi:MAG: AI-2E family transporter [Deltaproteobacteria bacterium]|nr:AI-2E family transporter [Deltaproteobacteria bacterium]